MSYPDGAETTKYLLQLGQAMAKRTKNQLRRMPELLFFGDDTLDYIEEIDKSLKGEDENPIKNPEVLPQKAQNRNITHFCNKTA